MNSNDAPNRQSLQRRPQTRNDDHNRLKPEDECIHNWYRFVLSFPPHLVRTYIKEFGLGPSHQVLDPFSGTGTTVVECKKLGIRSIGIEANPIASFASRVKTDWSPQPRALVAHAEQVGAHALKSLADEGIEDASHSLRPDSSASVLRTLSEDRAKLLLKSSISSLPLHKALTLLDALDSHYDARYSSHERLALAQVLVDTASNLRFGPEVGIGRVKSDAAVVETWLATVIKMARDLEEVKPGGVVETAVYRGDARIASKVLDPCSIDAVITSPPYPNEKDYTRTTRLESVALGFVNTKKDLQALKRDLVRSNTRGVYSVDTDDHWAKDFPRVQQLAEDIEARRLELGKTSGFERLYGRVTKLYFGGMARHLADLRRTLRPGAKLAYVVGDQASYLRVMIRTSEILSEIGQSFGYEVIKTDFFRSRFSTAAQEEIREEVLVLRWPGVDSRKRD